jgi:Domain of unknown function (DU1801)
MVKRKLKTVDEILDSLEPEKEAITEKFRRMVKNTIPDTAEIVRRGKITFVLNNKDFLSIRAAQSHVDLLFLCGTKCTSNLLKGTGTGKDLRHVEVRNISDFNETELVRLLKEAERLA